MLKSKMDPVHDNTSISWRAGNSRDSTGTSEGAVNRVDISSRRPRTSNMLPALNTTPLKGKLPLYSLTPAQSLKAKSDIKSKRPPKFLEPLSENRAPIFSAINKNSENLVKHEFKSCERTLTKHYRKFTTLIDVKRGFVGKYTHPIN